MLAHDALGQLEAGVLAAAEDARDGAHLLEHAEVPVGRAEGHVVVTGDELGDGDRPVDGVEQLHEPATA